MYAAFLIFLKEFQLLAKDRVGCFMLTFAPVVIIAVAGFSLGNIYGAHPGANAYLLPVVDQDHGAVADAIITALKREHVIIVSVTDDLGAARQAVNGQARTPLVIVIPPGTTAALTEGRTGQLLLYVDPVKRLEVNTIELRLGELCREVTAHARRQAQAKLASGSADRRLRLDRLGAELSQLQTGIVKYREEAAKGRAKAEADLQAYIFDDLKPVWAR